MNNKRVDDLIEIIKKYNRIMDKFIDFMVMPRYEISSNPKTEFDIKKTEK